VFGSGTADEGGVVNETVLCVNTGHVLYSSDMHLWCVALGLERSEKSLLGSEDLNSRGRVFGQVGQ